MSVLAAPVRAPATLPPAPDVLGPRCPRYRSLDLWRGLACLLVVVFHATRADWAGAHPVAGAEGPAGQAVLMLAAGLWAGVPLFFVISGYCIAATADANRRKGHGTADFFRRRVRRIFPPYWIFLGLSVLVVAVLGAVGWLLPLLGESYRLGALEAWQWVGTVTLTETWRHHLVGPVSWRLFWEQAWTLCYEEQFYAVCGLLLFLAPKRFFPLAGVVTLIVLCLTPFTFKKVSLPIQGFFFDGSWLLFAAGLLVYYGRNYAGRRLARAILLLLAAAVPAALTFRFVVLRRLVAGEGETMLASQFANGAVFALLLALLGPWDDRLFRTPALRPLAFCGQMCYSLYLVHYPVVLVVSHALLNRGVTGLWPTLLVTVPLAMTAALIAGRLFYLLVERHFLNPPRGPREGAGP
jgi:peptidoglycan/LPS O-acetylase OafA/YrhL